MSEEDLMVTDTAVLDWHAGCFSWCRLNLLQGPSSSTAEGDAAAVAAADRKARADEDERLSKVHHVVQLIRSSWHR